jgi:hypothetical protein
MRKILFVLIAVLLIVSCSNYDDSVSVCSVKLGRLVAKDTSSVSGTVADPAALFWRYTAVKTDLGSTTGQQTSEVAIQATAGYEGVVLAGFAPGDWTLKIYGYLNNGYAAEDLIYVGTCEARLTYGKTHEIPFNVEVQDGSRGTLKTVFPTTVLESAEFTVSCKGVYQGTDKVVGNITSPNPTEKTIKQGLWELTYSFYDKATTPNYLGGCTVQALVLNGATTTVTLVYETNTGSFKANVTTPSISDWTKEYVGGVYKAPANTKVGDIITLGKAAWKVLSVENGRALVISENALVQKRFDASSIYYANSEARTYLNGSFITDYGLSDVCIYNVDVTTDIETTTVTGNGSDKVFLLSRTEVFSYFGKASDGYHYSDSAIANYNGSAINWWTRTPDEKYSCVAYVYQTGKNYTTNPSLSTRYYRPAFWVQIE